jgi:FdhD protein
MTGTDAERFRDPMGLYRLGYAGPLLETDAVRWEGGAWAEQHERIVEETPVAIVYNGIPHVVMMATPTDLEDFALGFSLTEELIESADDLKHLEIARYSRGVEIQATVDERCVAAISERTRRLTGRTGCGICGADSVDAVLKRIHPDERTIGFSVAAVQRALESLAANQPLNAASGAVHAAGWAQPDGTVSLIREERRA